MVICSKCQFQSVDGWMWCNYVYTTILNGVHHISNKKIQNRIRLSYQISLLIFVKKYQMLAPWNGSHRKTGSVCQVLDAAALFL